MRKITKPSILIIVILLIFSCSSEELSLLEEGQKFDIKHFTSPSGDKYLTLMLHTDGVINYYSYIYLIPGKYDKKEIPKNKSFIKFPDATGLYLDWNIENEVKVFTCSHPEINNFKNERYKLILKIDREYIDSLIKAGKEVVRYKIP